MLRIGHHRLRIGAGGKAIGLHWLQRHGYQIPDTWVILPTDTEPRRDALAAALAGVVKPGHRYAVRSSADVEDGTEISFAGQFDSVLDVSGREDVIDAVLLVVKGADSESVEAYATARANADRAVRMAVLVQKMVQPTMAGVAFSANPVTGFSEVIIEAVKGSGEGLVQRGETPERWVRKAGVWRSAPDPGELPATIAEQLAADVAEMGKRFGRPVDVEWVLGGEGLTYVQLRPITGIGNVSYYSNKLSRGLLPGIIVPLVWSVNIPLVNGAWIRLLEQLVGPTGLQPNDLAARLYCRAYFNMGAMGTVFDVLGLPRESLELLSGMESTEGGRPKMKLTLKTLKKLPRVLIFATRLPGYERRTRRELAELRAAFADVRSAVDLESADSSAVLSTLDSLEPIMASTAYLNVLTPLLSEAHNHRLVRRLSRLGIPYEGLDFANRDEGDEGRDPTAAISALRDLSRELPDELLESMKVNGVEALRGDARAAQLVTQFDRFIDTYGHFSDSGTDFSYVPWREEPAAVVRLIDAHNQARSSTSKVRRLDLARVPKGRSCLRLFDRASRFQVLREEVSSFYTLCYGFQRPLYLRLSALCGLDSWVPAGRAIFYLTADEARDLALGSLDADRARSLALERYEDEVAVRDAIVPDVVFGDAEQPLHLTTVGSLTGVATSSGRHTGRAVKISSASQAPDLKDGDVIVVPYSDVAWTPLFSRAGAIVAESGGFLSHTSIVAREYGIPAVVSVSAAMNAIPQGALVEVDGFAGTVTVLSAQGDSDSEASESKVSG
ncbi:MAG: PEP-utilizing enzyme [Actinobacteria bacterium]|nr:PEP-utilizing enzyme [Actinomycetota bacterium]